MITFTKEQLIASAHARIEFAEMMLAGELEPLKERTWSIELELARIALASLEAVPAGWQVKKYGGNWVSIKKEDVDHYRFNEELPVREVYTAPPAPVAVPDALEDDIDSDDHPLLWSYNNGWNACRAAMTQGAENAESPSGNSPVIPDGWVILPADPTQAMMNAWLSEVANWRGHASGYRAMIAAAPKPEA